MKNTLLLILSLGLNFIYSQNCNSPSAYAELNINNIKAGLMTGGDMWWNGVEAKYEYPNNGTFPAKNMAFNNSLWLTGFDSNNDLKSACMLFRVDGFDFWPGPIINAGPWVEDSICSKFDRFFEVYKTEIGTHVNNINTLSLPLSLGSIAVNIKEWPGKGNQYLLSTYGMHIDEDLAPFNDSNNNGIYDPENGDYPLSKGDQCFFWVINDIGSFWHLNSGGDPIGVEIQCMAYAYSTNNSVNETTFYDYTLIKKTPGTLSEVYFSNAFDPEIGDPADDYLGCDTTLDYGFAYNGDTYDNLYGQNPPILITQYSETPNNIGLSSYMYLYIFPGTADPQDFFRYRNFQTGLWNDSTYLTNSGNGFNTIGNAVKHAYPGNPAVGTEWSEPTAGNPVGDRRSVQTTGPYTLIQYQPLEFTFSSIIIPTDTNYNGLPDKTTLINPVVNFVDNFLDTVNNKPFKVTVPLAINDFSDVENLVSIYPNPATDKIYINVDQSFDLSFLEIFDTNGRKIDARLTRNSIDLKDLPKGVYSLKLYSEKHDKVLIKKFIVQ